jgi:Metallopeptidase family M24
MFGMHPTLLVGPADWDAARLPKEEFIGRIAALWRDADPGIAGLVVYGSPRDHAELAYLTHFTPKLEPAIALVPRAGEPRLLVGGGANMIGAARPLTFVETLLPLRDAGRTIARWAGELGSGRLALVNGGAMAFGLRREIEAALNATPPDASAIVADAMRQKSPRELTLIREACASLQATFAAMQEAQNAGCGMTDMVLAGERAAWLRGAQDVRSLLGREGRLLPFTVPDERPADLLQVYAAVRHDGYWAEGFSVLSRNPSPVGEAARATLGKAVALMRPDALLREVAEPLWDSIRPSPTYPLTYRGFGRHIGLSLHEPDCLHQWIWQTCPPLPNPQTFAVGEVYSVRTALAGEDIVSTAALGGEGIVSTMVLITEGGHEILWPKGNA